MAYQLIYTSVRRGLIPGRSGYTIAARHSQIRERLVSELERISHYEFTKSGYSPRVFSHRIINLSGSSFHIFSRIVDAGSDYTGRTNYLAHHIVCDPSELNASQANPAEILSEFNWLDSFEGDPRYLNDDEIVDLSKYNGKIQLPAKKWKLLRGAAADAALLVDENNQAKNSIIVCNDDQLSDEKTLLHLIGESALIVQNPNNITFTTYYQDGDTLTDFQWVGCSDDSVLLDKSTSRETFRLSKLEQSVPNNAAATKAEKGKITHSQITKNKNNSSLNSPSSARVQTPEPSAIEKEKIRRHYAPNEGVENVKLSATLPRVSQGYTGADVVSSIDGNNYNNKQKETFIFRYLKHLIIGSISMIFIVALLLFYLLSYQPNQQLNNNIQGFLAERKYTEANNYLNKFLKERPNWKEKIVDIRRDQIFAPMQELTNKKLLGL